ncbi:MAG: hypothetical protein Q9227_006186 [Pyrenula ochraceoflavens]
MSYAPMNGLRSTRNHYVDPPTLIERARNAIDPLLKESIEEAKTLSAESTNVVKQLVRGDNKKAFKVISRRFLSVRSALVLIWVLLLWWGERLVFEHAVQSCDWGNWEKWPAASRPHRVVFIADPQLVDPHTYPGRPWPLSSITVTYSDLYLKRSYGYLQKYLKPDSVMFLGDLFDGGREWSTMKSQSPDKKFKKYDNSFWAKEYRRFVRIFMDRFAYGSTPISSTSPPTRKLIASLPGNHDLGFASGIQIPVKSRFEAYFGPTNRIDILGNHTFVAVDTVSLSAMDQADPSTGSSGHGDGTSTQSPPLSEIWAPTEDFLKGLKDTRGRLVEYELRRLSEAPPATHFHADAEHSKFLSRIDEISDSPPLKRRPSVNPSTSSSQFPTVLLTHVPLYRPPDSDCGPLRERGKSISISSGYQYQNVLTPSISREIIDRIGPAESVAHIYSGDDHDYCDWSHTEFTGGIAETTVKSMSLAMGVRRPGFLSLSMWNPIQLSVNDDDVVTPAKNTLQQNLCLLPDVLSIVIRYGLVLAVTLIVLFAHTLAARLRRLPDPWTNDNNEDANGDMAPTSYNLHHRRPRSKASSLSSADGNQQLSARSGKRLTDYRNTPSASRESSPSKFHHAREFHTKSYAFERVDDWGIPHRKRKKESLPKEFVRNVMGVAWPVIAWWGWLIWTS